MHLKGEANVIKGVPMRFPSLNDPGKDWATNKCCHFS